MIAKKQVFTFLIIIALVGSFIILKRKSTKEVGNNMITIGILQTASHPALDAVREGFIQELQNSMPKDVEFIVHNAEGNIANAHVSAQSFHNDNAINAIFAIATPALQAAASVEKHKPIIFGAITDPRALGVISPTTNVTGASDMINVPDTIAMIKELVPTAKTVGLIYNNAEMNSVMMVNSMKKELAKEGLKVLDFGVTNEADLLPALTSALAKADVLLAPTDNTVACAITLIAQQALQAKKPLFVSDNLLVEKGALAARGIDYKTNGKLAAQRAVAILKQGKKPGELPVAYATSGRIFVNKQTAQALNLQIPKSLEDNVTFFETK